MIQFLNNFKIGKQLLTFNFPDRTGKLLTSLRPQGERGFTLLELVISFTIISVITAITIVSYGALKSRADLNGNAQNIISILNVARSKTTASEGPSQWGVHFETTLFALFKGAAYNVSDPYTKIYNLPSSLELVNISLSPISGTTVDVVFDRITGQTPNNGSITLRKISDTSNLVNIIIEQSGQTTTTTLDQPPAETRLTDSRHMHFTYDGDATHTTDKLTLYFPAGPVTQDINIFDNTSGGVFSWSGTITVNGSDQVLSIRTHALSVLSAQFSVTRDKRYNDKELNIYLNGTSGINLIKYATDGAVTQDASAWVSAPAIQ